MTEVRRTEPSPEGRLSELFFSIVTRKVLERGNFISRDDLVFKPMRFIITYSETAKPFAGQPLEARGGCLNARWIAGSARGSTSMPGCTA